LVIHFLRSKLAKFSFTGRFYLQETFFARHKKSMRSITSVKINEEHHLGKKSMRSITLVKIIRGRCSLRQNLTAGHH
jgi:hypothetical protein